ncbi:C-type lectin lectoxin-Phi1-like [Clupea harengus]|uniref:C-type lectin lectoxin-Phi1-like n=1 Tax=Clupea harengus TaxID=7950 RepID=A0A8M1KDF9_CLUHA|nr:C-type lectin lectoxin-Phi1-like [Clupea harengus]
MSHLTGLDSVSSHMPRRFHFVNQSETWDEAQEHCRTEFTDLATVENMSDMTTMTNGTDGYDMAWIGLRKDTWMWSLQNKNISLEETNFTSWREAGKLALIRENKTWMEAFNYCESNDMELVSVTDEDTQSWAREVARGASTAHVWMGLYYICPLDVWFWISGVTVGCNHWAAGNGTGTGECCRAGALQAGGGKWVSRPETERLNFICRAF